jgi:hypothetical protein
MSKPIPLTGIDSPLQAGLPRVKWGWIVTSAAVIVCSGAGILYVAYPGSDTSYGVRQPAPGDISSLPHPMAADGSKVMRQVTAAGEKPELKIAPDLTLAGVIFGDNNSSLALISIAGKPAQPYAKGAYVTPGHLIHTIEREQVMLAIGPDKPVHAVLALVKKPRAALTPVAAPTSNSSVPDFAAASLPVSSPAMPLAGPPPRTDSRYRVGIAARRQHGSAESAP